MEKKDLRIVYMGTPDFAVEALRCLVEGGYNVVGVITMPDKPAGRGHKLQYSPVKQYALDHNLPLLQPERLKDEAFVEDQRTSKAAQRNVEPFRHLPQADATKPRHATCPTSTPLSCRNTAVQHPSTGPSSTAIRRPVSPPSS